MNLLELKQLLNSISDEDLRCMVHDDGDLYDISVSQVALDTNGHLVDDARKSNLPTLDRAVFLKSYNHPVSGGYWRSRFPTFDEYFQHYLDDQQKERVLIDNATPILMFFSSSLPH